MAAGDRIPWSYIATRVATSPVTANSSTFTTTETSPLVSVTFAQTSGLTYKINVWVPIQSTAAGDVCFCRIREDNNTGNQLDGANLYIGSTSANGYPSIMYAEYTAGSTGSKTIVFTGARTGGSGTLNLSASTSRPAWMTVDLIVS